MNTREMIEKINQLQKERAVAMQCVTAVLSSANENVKRDDLVACINDLAQLAIGHCTKQCTERV